MNKNTILIYLSAAIFGVLGVYLTFFAGNTDKYDSQTKAYRISPNESYDIDDNVTYYPIYYFKVDGRDYECRASNGSSSYPSEDKNTVYYDSSNPTNCKTEYEKSTSKFAGIICLIATAVIVYFFIIKKPSTSEDDYLQREDIDMERQYQFEQKNKDKIIGIVEKVQLIYKRVIIGIVIIILLVFTLLDTVIFKQTIEARNYIETTALLVDKTRDDENSVFDDYIYTFNDKQGKKQEIIISVSKDNSPSAEKKIKYNENNPQDYYEETSILDKSGIIWYVVKVVALILLIILFFNKKWLNKINVSASSGSNNSI